MRIWIIGNGPSLKETPLDLLRGEATFAINRIHLIYDKTDWRPSYYFKVDYNPFHKDFWKDEIYAHKDTPKYLWRMFKDGYPPDHPNYEDMSDGGVGDDGNTVWIDRCEKHHYYHMPNHKCPASWHLPELCTWGTGINTMMQIAVLMGYDKIYLLGCDVGYKPDYTKNFFCENYNHDLRNRAEHDNADIYHMHKIAHKSSPIPIYNAGIGGELEEYPRVNIYEVLETDPDLPQRLPIWRGHSSLSE